MPLMWGMRKYKPELAALGAGTKTPPPRKLKFTLENKKQKELEMNC